MDVYGMPIMKPEPKSIIAARQKLTYLVAHMQADNKPKTSAIDTITAPMNANDQALAMQQGGGMPPQGGPPQGMPPQGGGMPPQGMPPQGIPPEMMGAPVPEPGMQMGAPVGPPPGM